MTHRLPLYFRFHFEFLHQVMPGLIDFVQTNLQIISKAYHFREVQKSLVLNQILKVQFLLHEDVWMHYLQSHHSHHFYNPSYSFKINLAISSKYNFKHKLQLILIIYNYLWNSCVRFTSLTFGSNNIIPKI
jgi:hypothetical protein